MILSPMPTTSARTYKPQAFAARAWRMAQELHGRKWICLWRVCTGCQLRNVAQLPVIHYHVAAMPDAHGGIGATAGAVLVTRQAIISDAVGVDICCGIIAAGLSLATHEIDEVALKNVFGQISRDMPVGRA